MLEPLDIAPGNLETLADRIVACFIGNNDISTLAEGGNDTGDCGKRMGIDNAALGTKVSSNIGFCLDVDILRAVELGRSAGSDTVSSESLDCLLLDLLVSIEVIEVV